jgi:23S rRNA (guanine2445-N2)-methyltransferase / 23S rRNA (guanine2069-N7)-methyltransferase
VELIEMALRRLKTSGAMLFSTNFRKFKLDYSSLEYLDIEELTARTIPEDFKRTPTMHQLWRIHR